MVVNITKSRLVCDKYGQAWDNITKKMEKVCIKSHKESWTIPASSLSGRVHWLEQVVYEQNQIIQNQGTAIADLTKRIEALEKG